MAFSMHASPPLMLARCCATLEAPAAPEACAQGPASRTAAPVPRLARVSRRRRAAAVASASNAPTEPFSTEPGGFSTSFAAFEKRDSPKVATAAADKPPLAPDEVVAVPLESEVRDERGCAP